VPKGAGKPTRDTGAVQILRCAMETEHKIPCVCKGTRVSMFEGIKRAKRLIRIEFSWRCLGEQRS
jgi:hypothetical protein